METKKIIELAPVRLGAYGEPLEFGLKNQGQVFENRRNKKNQAFVIAGIARFILGLRFRMKPNLNSCPIDQRNCNLVKITQCSGCVLRADGRNCHLVLLLSQ